MKKKNPTVGNDLKIKESPEGTEKKKRRYRVTKKHPYHHLGREDLRKIRGKLWMSARELGELIGVSKITISMWELGFNPIPSSVAMLIQILVDISGSRYGDEKFGLDEEISLLEDD